MRVTLGKFPGIRYSRVPVKGSGIFAGLFASERDCDRAETVELYAQVRGAHEASPFADRSAPAAISVRILDAIREITPIPSALARPIGDAVLDTLFDEDRVFDFPTLDPATDDLSIEERFKLRNFLRDKHRFVSSP